MSFEAVWGFNPEKVLRAQASRAPSGESIDRVGDQTQTYNDEEEFAIPRSRSSQLFHLQRMLCS
jgi:hypothetical protein